jgi:hypothetical protein
MHRRAAFFVVGGVLVVVVIALLGELLVPRMTSRVVNVGNVHTLTPGTPLDWQHRLWVVLDKRGALHAFPYMYEATPTRLYQTRWLDSTDSLAQTWFKNDPCVLAVGDGIFTCSRPRGRDTTRQGDISSGPSVQCSIGTRRAWTAAGRSRSTSGNGIARSTRGQARYTAAQ